MPLLLRCLEGCPSWCVRGCGWYRRARQTDRGNSAAGPAAPVSHGGV